MSFALGFLTAVAVLASIVFLRVRRWRRFSRRGAGLPFRRLLARLHATPAQESLLIQEATALRAELRALRQEAEPLRLELADLLGEPSLEAARVDSVLAAREAKLAALRRRASEAVARFHATLDGAQRDALAAMVREGRPHGAFAHARGC